MAIAIVVGILEMRWRAPRWLAFSGAWTSIGLLAVLGIVNIRAVLGADPASVVQPVAFKWQFRTRFERHEL